MRAVLVSLSVFLATFGLPAGANELQNIVGMANSQAKTASLEGFIMKFPKDPEARYQLALQYLSSKMESQAEEQLRTCMELAPIGSEMHTNCILQLRHISEAKSTGRTQGPASNELKTTAGSNSIVSTVKTGGTMTYGVLKKTNKSSAQKQPAPTSNAKKP